MTPENIKRVGNAFAARLEAAGAERGLRAAKKEECADLYIYDEIGSSPFGGGISGTMVAERLQELKGCKSLNVYVNSPGGSVFEGKAIYALLKRCEMKVTCVVDGIAASAASFICCAGDRIVTMPQATWMIHRAMGGAFGFSDDLRATADVLDLESRNIASIYAERTGRSVDEMLSLMAAETWMDAARAKELGFTDEIGEDDRDGRKMAATAPIRVLAAVDETRRRATPSMRREMTLKRLAASRGDRASPGRATK